MYVYHHEMPVWLLEFLIPGKYNIYTHEDINGKLYFLPTFMGYWVLGTNTYRIILLNVTDSLILYTDAV